MSPSRARVGVSADAFVAVVRAYADRVHDDVRRLGCSATEAAEIVETSAVGLAERLRARPHEVRDLIGTWFRDARVYADRVAGTTAGADVEAGAGIVQRSEDDAATRAALARLAERDRVALLLRDAYDLPYVSTGVALGLDADAAATLVARARLRFLRLAAGEAPADPEDHDEALATAARLADGQLAPEAVAGAERHVAKCPICTAVVPAQREARRLLSGLAIIAMRDADRDALLTRATAAAERLLPTAAEVEAAGERGPRALLPIPLVAGCLGGALVLGSLLGLATGGGNDGGRAAPSFIPDTPTASATASATPSVTPTASRPTATATATAGPSTAPPSQGPSEPPPFSPYPGSARVALSSPAGPNSNTVTVTGTGWQPGAKVHLVYLDPLRRPTGQTADAVAGRFGGFTAEIVCYDPQSLPGPHYVRASNAYGQSAEATYTST